MSIESMSSSRPAVPHSNILNPAYVSTSDTLSAAAAHLKVPVGTFEPLYADIGFLVVMRMATTIEPILNDAIEVEIGRLQREGTPYKGAAYIADFVRGERQFQKKAKLAWELGLLSQEQYDFVDAIMLVRHHYAHHISNLSLNIVDAVAKASEQRNDRQLASKIFKRELAGLIELTEKPEDKLTYARFGMVWMFSSFLASALKVIGPAAITLDMATTEASDTVSIAVSNPANK
jgi:hypothetical protein